MPKKASEGNVAVALRDHVATIELRGVGGANVLTDSVMTSLQTVLAEMEADDRVWVVILRGQPGALGADPVPAAPSLAPQPVAAGGVAAEAALAARAVSAQPSVYSALRAFPKPVICGLEGPVRGRSLALALACDLRIATASTVISCPEVVRGMIPGAATTQLLTRIAGPAYAADLLLTGREIQAAEAMTAGLVSRIADSGDGRAECEQLAAQMSKSAPLAMRFAKEAIRAGADLPLAAGVTLELDLSLILQLSGDRAEGLTAFHERREPHYNGR